MQAQEAIVSAGPGDRVVQPKPRHRHESTCDPMVAGEPFLTPALRRLLARAGGAALITFSAFMAIALATWAADDPSLTFANGREVTNWMGFAGSSFADLAMQFFGMAAPLIAALPLVWGLCRLTARPMPLLRLRMAFAICGVLLLSTALACFAVPSGWPLHVGLGGVIGDAVLNIPAAFLGSYPQGFLAVVFSTLFAAPGAWCIWRAGSWSAANIDDGPDQPMEAAASHDGDMDEPGEGIDWAAKFAAPIGLSLHLAYSFSAMTRKALGLGKKPRARRNHLRVRELAADPTWGDEPFDAADDDWSHQAREAETHPWEEDAEFDTPSIDAFETMDDDPQVTIAPALDWRSQNAEDTDDGATVRPAPKVTRAKAPAKPRGGRFQLPRLDLLSEPKELVDDPSLSNDALEENARLLEGVLDDFGVKGQIIKVRPGPVVTLYELEPAPGIKSSRVIGLADDIARSMSAIAARVAVVPGRNAIGIELPNKKRETVFLREQLASKAFRTSKAKLPMCLGKTIGGEPVIADMAKMPHLLVAGTTGSGKSVAINTMILSLLYRHSPERCKLIMIDPKMLELSIYDGIPHLLTPVVVDPKKAVVALKWTVREMEQRYKLMSKLGVRNIDGFNARVAEASENDEPISRTVQTGFDQDTGEAIFETEELDLQPMPFIVVVIDEMADLMMVAGKDIEGTVQRLAQMARAAGIHVIMATQRPSTDVITGTIKANFPTRISFQVTSKIDSRVMLGESGAEQLLGMGDMLYMAGGGRITRVHGPFVDDKEVEDVVGHLKTQGVPQYLEGITEEDEDDEDTGAGGGSAGGMGDSDDPYDQAVAIVLRDRKASTSYIQRRLSVGYNKAASLIERMEQDGVISPANHAGKREILVPAEDETI